jgi:hypothetical protein
MLSGRAPFQSPTCDDHTSVIVERIKSGDFSLKGPVWDFVSDDAKTLIQGWYAHLC